MQLTGNTILVTGGGTGIGRGLAEALHRLGNEIVIAGRRQESLQAVVDANPGMHYMLLDQGDSDNIRQFAAKLAARYPRLNVVINNAGVMPVEDLRDGDVGPAEQTVAVNLLGVIRLTAALMPMLLSRQQAAIINVTSALAFVPKAAAPTYSATKAALHSYTQSLRLQLHDSPVEVIEIIPPRVQTEIQAALGDSPEVMPVNAFVSEALAQLHGQLTEIVVDRAKPMRFAARDGSYERLCAAANPEFPPR